MIEMYFVAVLLPQELDDKVNRHKEWMKEKYNCKVGLKSPAHITIIPPFWLHSELEGRLVQITDAIASTQSKFDIQTAGFDAFKPRTLFIAVASNPDLHNLKKKTEKEFIYYPELNIKKESRPFHPHITIATRDVHKAAFYEAWDHFKGKEFHVNWQAQSLSILKHNKKNWDVVHTSQFA